MTIFFTLCWFSLGMFWSACAAIWLYDGSYGVAVLAIAAATLNFFLGLLKWRDKPSPKN